MKKLVKLLSLVLVFGLAFSLMAACGGNNDANTGNSGNNAEPNNTNGSGSGETKTDVVIATANEPPTMAPHQHNAVAGGYMNILTHNTLLKLDLETLSPVPNLVESYEVLSDLEWQLNLRHDVKFHDGSDMTAEDVVASMQYAREHTSYTSTYSSFWDKLEIKDDYTIILTTKDVYAKTLYDLASHYVLPKELIEKGDDAIAATPIGTGPYKFVKWTLGDSVEFEAFEDYWEGAPAIKKITYRIIPEGSSRTIALEAGEIDFIVEVDNNDLSRLEETDGIEVINKTGTSFNFLVLNNERAPFDNQDFRHFMNCAINKDALVEVALNGAGTGNYTQTPVVFEGAATEIPDSYDKELAQQYLDKSGVDPSTVVFSCICSDDVKRRCGEVIQATLAEYGVTMNLESMDLATYLSTAAEGNFETCIGNCTTSNTLGFIEYKYHSKMIGGSNWSRTNDPKIDELYDTAVQTLDETERMKLIEECVAYIQSICPQVPTYSMNVVRAMDADLQGFEVNASGNTYWHYVSWAE